MFVIEMPKEDVASALAVRFEVSPAAVFEVAFALEICTGILRIDDLDRSNKYAVEIFLT